MIRISLLLFALVLPLHALAQAPVADDKTGAVNGEGSPAATAFARSTVQYASTGGQDLYLDRIVAVSTPTDVKSPVIVFSFGGGWEGGERDDPRMASFFNFFASLGYTVVTIDYRLGIKEAKRKGELTAENGPDMYLRAIQWGVEDLFDATAYVIRNADAWNIDPQRIVIVGSSAGAINSLVAEYNVANETDLAREKLPPKFRYAGVISMAGAFWLKAGTPLEFRNPPAPIMFFHGAKDQLVTYDEAQENASAYGPVAFMRKFEGPAHPKWFVDFVEGDHVVSLAPIIDYRHEMAAFLEKLVFGGQKLSVHTVEQSVEERTLQNIMKLYVPRWVADPSAQSKQ